MYKLHAIKSTRVVQKPPEEHKKFKRYLLIISIGIITLFVITLISLVLYFSNPQDNNNFKNIPDTVDYSRLPSNFPDNIPVYPNGEIDVATYNLGQVYLQETTTDSPNEILSWYKKQFAKQDWKVAMINDYRLEVRNINNAGSVFVEEQDNDFYKIVLTIGNLEIKRETIERKPKIDNVEEKLQEINQKREPVNVDF